MDTFAELWDYDGGFDEANVPFNGPFSRWKLVSFFKILLFSENAIETFQLNNHCTTDLVSKVQIVHHFIVTVELNAFLWKSSFYVPNTEGVFSYFDFHGYLSGIL